MPCFPGVKELANRLHFIAQDLAASVDADSDDLYETDVRLRVTDDSWEVLTGDPSYDQDHRGYWGASGISSDATERDCVAVAEELISQAESHFAESESAIKTMTLELDSLDFDAIQNAISRRQAFRVLPDGRGNLAGRLVAEICRGWMEMIEDHD